MLLWPTSHRHLIKNTIIALSFVSLFGFQSTAHAESLKGIAKRFAARASQQGMKKVAVLSFPYHNGIVGEGSTIVAEKFTTLLSNYQNINLIERSLLNQVLEEMKLQQTGLVDQETTKKLGKLLGVDAVVTGTLIDSDNQNTEVNARLINPETGQILAGGVGKLPRTWKKTVMFPRKS